jgi:hypothetical protein
MPSVPVEGIKGNVLCQPDVLMSLITPRSFFLNADGF